MCGIVGFWTKKPFQNQDQSCIEAMTNRLHHRGPDAGDVWQDPSRGVALGHRRLSIIDLSVEGAQPMHSRDGRWSIVFNGEIYNHEVLRNALSGHVFRGHSDTESLVEHIAVFGVLDTLQAMNGMFAFAAWDHKEQKMWLARDRIGIKPLYYGRWSDRWIFGSELKSFQDVPGFRPDLNRDAVTSMLRFNYIPAPQTIYRGMYKLPPGHLICLERGTEEVIPQAWWTPYQAAVRAKASMFEGSDVELVDQLEALLTDAVGIRMAADVPLGAFLSGGLDSSTVVALMQAQSTRPVQTFSIGFREAGFNEATHAKEIAAHLNTEHTELYVTPEQARDVIPLIPKYWDEPFSDSSQIPTFLVCQLARENVTVALSGDGGDELFGGYNRYSRAPKMWQLLSKAPQWTRRIAATSVMRTPRMAFRGLDAALRWTPGVPKLPLFEDKAYKAAPLLAASSADDVYLGLLSHWKHPDTIVKGGVDQFGQYVQTNRASEFPNFLERMMLLDAETYMVDDILTKVDRASMAVSLEARVPLLDHRVFEFAWSIPIEQRVRSQRTKWPIFDVLSRHVPTALFDRPKMGFGVPIGAWLRGPLRDWAEHLLDERRLREEGVFDAAPIRKIWDTHCRGDANMRYALWDILMFQSWLDEHKTTVGL